MSVPNSILSVLLVVVWLFVLVPMFVNRRPKVMTVSETALNTRVLFRGGLDKLKHRIRPGVSGNTPLRDEGADEGDSVTRRPVAEMFADEYHDSVTPHDAPLAEQEDSAHRDEDIHDARLVSARAVPAAGNRFATTDNPDSFEDDRFTQVAHRLGRGGFNPTADASARAQRYAIRQRMMLSLLISLVASVVLALTITSFIWIIVAALASTLLGYLCYLRQQVRVEERIRARRMTRFARVQGSLASEDVIHSDETRSARRPRKDTGTLDAREQPHRAPRPRVVAIDDDDPDFADLSPAQDHRWDRASGE